MLAIFGIMLFREVVGHGDLKAHLIQSVRTGRVSHALLFSGTPGSGHYPLALALAQYLHCSSPGEEDSCGVCPSCHQSAAFVHPDTHFVFPVARTAKITGEPASDDFIDPWRQYLSENPYPFKETWFEAMGVENKQAGIFRREAQEILRKMSFKPYESEFKVVIFWLPEMMNPTAANKLLKIVEEPADFTVFLFVTQQPEDILPTILSRTQLIKVPRIADKDLKEKLMKDFPGAISDPDGTIQVANGDYLKARELIEEREQTVFNRDKFISWMRMAYKLKMPDITAWVDEMSDIGRERQKTFLLYGLRMIRENFMINQGMKEMASLDREESNFSSRFNAFIHPGNIEELMREFNLAIAQIGMNANPKILFTDMSCQIYKLLNTPVSKTG